MMDVGTVGTIVKSVVVMEAIVIVLGVLGIVDTLLVTVHLVGTRVGIMTHLIPTVSFVAQRRS